MNGNIIEGPNGVAYDRQPIGVVTIPLNCTYSMLNTKLCKRFRIDTTQQTLQMWHRYPVLLENTISNYFLVPIECDDDMESLNNFYSNCVELYLNIVPIDNTVATTIEYGCAQVCDLIARPSIGSSSPVLPQVTESMQLSLEDHTTQGDPIQLVLSNIPLTDPTSDPFEDCDPYEDVDINEDIDEDCNDEGSSSEGVDEVGDDEPNQVEGDEAVNDEAGPSTCPMVLPPYVVPTVYTHLDLEAIAQNAPMIQGVHEDQAPWDPKQEFRKGLCFKDKEALKNAAKWYSMEAQREYKVKLSNKNVWIAKCKQGVAKCKWHVRANKYSKLRDVESCILLRSSRVL